MMISCAVACQPYIIELHNWDMVLHFTVLIMHNSSNEFSLLFFYLIFSPGFQHNELCVSVQDDTRM